MSKLSKRSIGAVLVFCCGVAALAYWLYWEEDQKEPSIVSISRFDFIFSKDHKLVTSLADIPDLREFSVEGDDIEIRIWRAYSISTLEGVFLKRINDRWSGLHIGVKTDERGDVQAAEVKQLKTPKLGWESFWAKLIEKGILNLPLTPENECDIKYIDGIRYVVEVNQNGTYRNYQYQEGNDECRESKQMTEIGEIVGMEFDSGQEKCKRFEWFACMTERRL